MNDMEGSNPAIADPNVGVPSSSTLEEARESIENDVHLGFPTSSSRSVDDMMQGDWFAPLNETKPLRDKTSGE